MNKPQVILKDVRCFASLKPMVIAGVKLLNDVIQTDEYHNEFMAFNFVQTEGKTNQQLWDWFCKAPIEISIHLYDMGWRRDHWSKTIGFEDASTPGILYVNSYFVGTPFQIADNVDHECWHVLGLSHNHPSDRNSVPYGNNQIFENTMAKLHPEMKA